MPLTGLFSLPYFIQTYYKHKQLITNLFQTYILSFNLTTAKYPNEKT